MTKTEFNDMLLTIIKSGVRPTMFYKNDSVWYDLNTGMKSHLHMVYDESAQLVRVEGRYEHKATVTDLDELVWEVRKCTHGRDYMNGDWAGLIGGENEMASQ